MRLSTLYASLLVIATTSAVLALPASGGEILPTHYGSSADKSSILRRPSLRGTNTAKKNNDFIIEMSGIDMSGIDAKPPKKTTIGKRISAFINGN